MKRNDVIFWIVALDLILANYVMYKMRTEPKTKPHECESKPA